MGRRAKLLSILLLCGATSLSADQAARRILWDFRTDRNQGPVKGGSEIPLNTQRQILSTLFPKYLTSDGACNPEKQQQPIDDAKLEAKRATGQMVPSIEQYVDGSFTAPGRQQTAYFIKIGECFACTATYWGTYRLAIYEGPRLVASVPLKASGSLTVADVNNDGTDELLLRAIGFSMGEVEENAWLVSLRGGELQTIRGFESVYENTCASQAAGPVTASVIAYTPTQLFVEEYQAPCKGAAAQGNMPALADFKPVEPGHE